MNLEPTGGTQSEGMHSLSPPTLLTSCVSSDTLEHFSQPAVVLSEVHRVLKDEGRLVVWVPFWSSHASRRLQELQDHEVSLRFALLSPSCWEEL